MKSKRCRAHLVRRTNRNFLGIRMPTKKEVLQDLQQKMLAADQTKEAPIIGREYFRNPEVNIGFYSKKREGVADVDPKVIFPF